jgi:hypothetical protein
MFDLGTLGAGLNIVSGLFGSSSAKKAAQEQQRRLQQAMGIQQGVYDTARADNAPYARLGDYGTNALLQGLQSGDLTRRFTADDLGQDPGYAFRQAEAEKAMRNQLSTQGSTLSGPALKALERFRQGFASNEFNNAYGRFTSEQDRAFSKLMGVTGVGEGAVSRNQQAGQNYAGAMTGLLTGMGDAAAAGRIGSANALTAGLGGAYNAFMDNELLKRLPQPKPKYAGGNFDPVSASGIW